eukprot:CAMPEP_0113822874 /NCGR_PEP_ID=MMETSP0328-20130328/2461_1 /TAXON_ID=39455 /ORGANISM="Alexandrium minutum" /LENGTH=76 /DNA_ID=CAMNT_0000790815 /DNA_START=516 /DNA_END=744 /DNA_ORIENTATION=+ /assembly_acc=CAM_ASM_000350
MERSVAQGQRAVAQQLRVLAQHRAAPAPEVEHAVRVEAVRPQRESLLEVRAKYSPSLVATSEAARGCCGRAGFAAK